MIKFIDNTTLEFTDVDGQVKRVGYHDPENYFRLLNIRNEQLSAESENTTARGIYQGALESFQLLINGGNTGNSKPPVKPKMKVVSDNGTTVLLDFSPPLPDPVYPSTGGPVINNPGIVQGPDKVLDLLLLVNSKLDKLLAR